MPADRAAAPRRVFGYCRVSSADQASKGTSLEAQREEILRYCAHHRLPEPTFFVEVESGSGAKAESRVQQKRLESMATAGDVVVVTKQDRWGRSTREFLRSIDTLAQQGARFVSIAENLDAGTAEGRLMITMMAGFAEHELARIRERTVGNRQRLRRLGFYVEGKVPWGYVTKRSGDDKAARLVPDPELVPVVRRMFALSIEGRSTREIAAALRHEFPSVSSLDETAIGRRLHDRRYIGEMPTVGSSTKRPHQAAEWIKSHEPIVDRATFTLAQASLVKRRSGGAPPTSPRSAGFLLLGLASCGHCGRRIRAHAVMPYASVQHAGYYQCAARTGCTVRPRARQDEVDALAGEQLLARVEELREALAKPRRRAVESAHDYEAERDILTRRRDRIVDAIADGTLTNEQARARLGRLDVALAEVDRREAEAVTRKPLAPVERRALLRDLGAIRTSWARTTVEQRRAIIGRLAVSITLSRTEERRYTRGAWALEIQWKEVE